MKFKTFTYSAILLALSSLCFQSCIGNFTLTNKVLTWNRNVNNKFVNELVFFAFWVLPVYEVTAVADLLVINSIEFWSGNNPLEANNKVIKTDDGNYQILADKTGYKVITPEGQTMYFNFDETTQTWSFHRDNTDGVPFLRFVDDNHVQMPDNSGNFVDVELSDDGLQGYSSLVMQPVLAIN